MLAIEFNRENTLDASFRQFQSSYHIHIRYIFADALFRYSSVILVSAIHQQDD